MARGGLLCDDMGLGKTLTTLALVAVNQPAGIVLGPAPTEPAAAAEEEAETAARVARAAAEEPDHSRSLPDTGVRRWRRPPGTPR